MPGLDPGIHQKAKGRAKARLLMFTCISSLDNFSSSGRILARNVLRDFSFQWSVGAESAMDGITQQFRIEEYKALRAEILYQIQDIDQIKFWVTAAIAAYYSFMAAKFLIAERNTNTLTGPLWVWAAPLILPSWEFCGFNRTFANSTFSRSTYSKLKNSIPASQAGSTFINCTARKISYGAMTNCTS
jgi:hypothetical protein